MVAASEVGDYSGSMVFPSTAALQLIGRRIASPSTPQTACRFPSAMERDQGARKPRNACDRGGSDRDTAGERYRVGTSVALWFRLSARISGRASDTPPDTLSPAPGSQHPQCRGHDVLRQRVAPRQPRALKEQTIRLGVSLPAARRIGGSVGTRGLETP